MTDVAAAAGVEPGEHCTRPLRRELQAPPLVATGPDKHRAVAADSFHMDFGYLCR